jgi:hypothetical protein
MKLETLFENRDENLRYGIVVNYVGGESRCYSASSFFSIPARDIQRARDVAENIANKATANFGVVKDFCNVGEKIESVGITKVRYGEVPEGAKRVRISLDFDPPSSREKECWYIEKIFTTPKYKVKKTKAKWSYYEGNGYPQMTYIIGEGREARSINTTIYYDKIDDSWTAINPPELGHGGRKNLSLAELKALIKKLHPTITDEFPAKFVKDVKNSPTFYMQENAKDGWDKWSFNTSLFDTLDKDATYEQFIEWLDKLFRKRRNLYQPGEINRKFTPDYLKKFYKLFKKAK